MGFLDKAKEAASQAAAKAQQGVAQGQAKMETMQAKRAADGLLRDLGAAFYAEQRAGGSRDAVMQALAALDAHAAQHGPIELGATGAGAAASGSTYAGSAPPAGSAPVPPPPGQPPQSTAAGGTPQGNFTLDDL